MRLGSLKRGTKTKPAQGDINRKEGRRNQYNADGKCRNPKRKLKRYPGNVEAVDKTRIKEKRETKTKGEKAELRLRPYAWGSYIQGPCGTRGYTRAGPIIKSRWRPWRYSDGNTKRSPVDVGVGTKRRIQNSKYKHDTEGRGDTTKLPWKFLELWPADY